MFDHKDTHDMFLYWKMYLIDTVKTLKIGDLGSFGGEENESKTITRSYFAKAWACRV